VFLFHGHNWTLNKQTHYLAWLTRFDAEAEAENFILVYPQGLPGPQADGSPGGGAWFNPWRYPGYADDIAFVDDLLNHLESQLCVNPARVFSTGYSNGAIMSVGLACNLSNRIAAIAPVDAIYYPPWSTDLVPGETCPDTRPVPVIGFHGTADTYIPIHGGSGSTGNTGLRDIEAAVMPDWAVHNGCSTTPVMSTPVPGVRLAENLGCANGATTEFYVVEDVDEPGPLTEGMGHQWPDSRIDPVAVSGQPSLGLNTHLLHATDLIWDFFEAHPLVAGSVPAPSPTTGPTLTSAPESVSQTVPPGSTVTTDTESDGATPSDSVETTITSPNGGSITILESAGSGPSGYSLLGSQVQISAPPATPGNPLVITFLLDATVVPLADATNIVVFKNGVPLPNCTGAPGIATPDACVSNRSSAPGGDISITALTSTASTWILAVPQAQPAVGGVVDQLTARGAVSQSVAADAGFGSAGSLLVAGLGALFAMAAAGVYTWKRARRGSGPKKLAGGRK
jgi:polyhydroxybutyrate depolymerase